MGVIKTYVQAKENATLQVAKETEKLYLEGLSYREALEKATKELSKVSVVANLKKDSI